MKPLSAFDILAAVAGAWGIPPEELTVPAERTKTPTRAAARAAAALLIREALDLPLTEIARALGVRNHTTVHYAIARARERARTEPGFADRLTRVRSALDIPPPRRRAIRWVAPGAAGRGRCSRLRGAVRAA